MPMPDDFDPVQDRKAARERTHVTALADAVGVRVAEIEDVPGTRIQTEHLCDSPQGRSVTRRRMRMLMAFDLFTAKHTGSMTYCGNTTDLQAWCWKQADLFIGEADNPPFTPAPPTVPSAVAVAVTGGPHTADAIKAIPAPAFDALPADQRSYLAWLASFGAEGIPPSAHCTTIGPERSSAARRLLQKAGLIESCPWEDTHGFRVSDAGLWVLECKRRESREIAA